MQGNNATIKPWRQSKAVKASARSSTRKLSLLNQLVKERELTGCCLISKGGSGLIVEPAGPTREGTGWLLDGLILAKALRDPTKLG